MDSMSVLEKGVSVNPKAFDLRNQKVRVFIN